MILPIKRHCVDQQLAGFGWKFGAMSFSIDERKQMLALKWGGDTVIARLEQIGFSSLSSLAHREPDNLTLQISQMMDST